jgi:hypothetical protein
LASAWCCNISGTPTVGDGTLAVGGGNLTVDDYTLNVGGDTSMIDGIFAVSGYNLMSVGRARMVDGSGTLMGHGQHRLTSTIASMTPPCRHQANQHLSIC